MTVERTKQIFGNKMSTWTDEQVLEFISQMSVVGDELLKIALHTDIGKKVESHAETSGKLTTAKNYGHTGKELK